MFKILRDLGHMELALLAGIEPQSEGLARAQRQPDRPINGQRHDEASVVVCVLADQIDAPRRPDKLCGRDAKAILESLHNTLPNAHTTPRFR